MLASFLCGSLIAKVNIEAFFENMRYGSILTGQQLIIRAPTTHRSQDISCFAENIHCVIEDDNVIDAYFSVQTASECQYTCSESTPGCQAFTWFGDKHPIFPNSCFLFSSCKKARRSVGSISGPRACLCGSPSSCQGDQANFIQLQEIVESEMKCQALCSGNRRCHYYTWFSSENRVFGNYCFLFSVCNKMTCNCIGCRSGPQTCFTYTMIPDKPQIGAASNKPGIQLPTAQDIPQFLVPNFLKPQQPQNTNPGGVPSENSVINYMPSLQWLLVNINNNQNNKNNISIKTA